MDFFFPKRSSINILFIYTFAKFYFPIVVSERNFHLYLFYLLEYYSRKIVSIVLFFFSESLSIKTVGRTMRNPSSVPPDDKDNDVMEEIKIKSKGWMYFRTQRTNEYVRYASALIETASHLGDNVTCLCCVYFPRVFIK